MIADVAAALALVVALAVFTRAAVYLGMAWTLATLAARRVPPKLRPAGAEAQKTHALRRASLALAVLIAAMVAAILII